jgi:hypothetical protein
MTNEDNNDDTSYDAALNGKHSDNQKQKRSNSEIALETAKKHCSRLFVDEYQVPHAAIQIGDHLQIFPINNKSFKNWFRKINYHENGIILDSQAVNDICGLLSAHAEYDCDEIHLSLRTAYIENKSSNEVQWYYDLSNKNWEFVKITSKGWYITKNQIIFRRYNNQQPQVYPTKDYDPRIFDRFMNLLNVRADDKDTKLLVKIYIISLFIPKIQKVVLMPHGTQGSAKSSLEELIKMLVDPSIIKTLVFPRDINELIQQLSHNYVVYYDNVSKIPEWISDQLCRAVSGSGSSKRQLYTDDDDVIRSFKRCIGFNGINLTATKADLLDRGLITRHERIAPNKQRKPEDIWREAEEIRPQLLGYILDILVKVLDWKNNGSPIILDGLPRMSEFAEYGEMISRIMGNPNNAFLDAYYRNIALQSEEVIENSAVAICVRDMMFEKYTEKNNDNREEWKGTPTALLGELKQIADDPNLNIDTKTRFFPKSANALSRRLNEIAENLKSIGLIIQWSKEDKKRIIMIRKITSPSSPLSRSENHI